MTLPASERDGLADLALLVRAFQISKMLQVAAALGLADRVDDGPKSITALAVECGANASMLLRLCRALAAFGIFSVDAAGNVSQSARSVWLRTQAEPTLHYAALYWTTRGSWSAWGSLEHAIRTGECPFEEAFGQPMFSYLKEHPEEAGIFQQSMEHSPDDRHAAVVEAYDFSGVRVVVDVGGGNGALLKSILAVNAETIGLLYDQDAVVAAAPALLAAAGLASRCRVQAGDFFQSVPSGGDCYTLSQILHDWNDERCLTILRNCQAAMKPDGRLLIIDRVLGDEPGQTNPMNFLSDMHMMVLFPDAKQRSLGEHADLLREVDFSEPRAIPTRSPFSVIEAKAI
jgi:SAM-dependent methyltransferase